MDTPTPQSETKPAKDPKLKFTPDMLKVQPPLPPPIASKPEPTAQPMIDNQPITNER